MSLVGEMLAGAPLGGGADLEIEKLLRELWGLSGDDGVYIAKELAVLPLFGRLAQMDGDRDTAVKRARQRRRRTLTQEPA